MRCPVCGAKLYQKQICPYCKITDEQILGASNRRVKECRKNGDKDLICFTTVVPSDISRLKLVLYTIFLGWLGVNHYYVLRNVRGTFSLLSFSLSVLFFALALTTKLATSVVGTFFTIVYDIAFFMMAFNLVLWVTDIIAVVFKGFKIPVVLKEKESKK